MINNLSYGKIVMIITMVASIAFALIAGMNYESSNGESMWLFIVAGILQMILVETVAKYGVPIVEQ